MYKKNVNFNERVNIRSRSTQSAAALARCSVSLLVRFRCFLFYFVISVMQAQFAAKNTLSVNYKGSQCGVSVF